MNIKSVNERRKQGNGVVEELVNKVERELDKLGMERRLDFDATGYPGYIVEQVTKLYQDAGYKAFFNTGKQWEPCYLLQLWW